MIIGKEVLFLIEVKTVMEKFNISEDRYKIFFSYENQYGVFRPQGNIHSYLNSSEYDLICASEYSSDSPDDALKDISFLVRAGKLDLKANDVISIKINGFSSSYRFYGLRKESEFVLVPDFLRQERNFYIDCIHSLNMVLSVLDAKLIPIDRLNLEKSEIYCIDKETFSPSDRSGSVVSNYSLWALKNNMIFNMNPCERPFVMISNALYFFQKKRNREKNALLLLDKNEFELIRDFHDLKNIELFI